MTDINIDLQDKSITECIYNAISNNFKRGENNLVIFFYENCKKKKWVWKIEKIKNGYDIISDCCGCNKLTKDKNGKISASTQAVITDIRNFIKDGTRHVVRTCSDMELINLELEEYRLDIIEQKREIEYIKNKIFSLEVSQSNLARERDNFSSRINEIKEKAKRAGVIFIVVSALSLLGFPIIKLLILINS